MAPSSKYACKIYVEARDEEEAYYEQLPTAATRSKGSPGADRRLLKL
jgi:hypothetical protein